MRLSYYMIGLFLIAGCGGNGSGVRTFNDPPTIANTYKCISGCNGVCIFDHLIEITQQEETIHVDSPSGTGMGFVDDRGFIEYSDGENFCSGQWGKAGFISVECETDSTQCQKVRYASQEVVDLCLQTKDCCKNQPNLCL